MRVQKLLLAAAVIVAAVLSGVQTAAATLALAVDFDDSFPGSDTETGFVPFNSSDAALVAGTSTTYSTTEGNVTVTLMVTGSQQGYFHRAFVPDAMVDSGAFTYASLYNDFVFSNDGGTISIDLSGPGIQANQAYQITWYSLTNALAPSQGEFRPDAGTGSTGSIVPYASAPALGVYPTTNDEYAFTGVWQTSGSVLGVDAVMTGGSLFNRVNGFQITAAVPEGSAFLFGGVAAMVAGGSVVLRRLRSSMLMRASADR